MRWYLNHLMEFALDATVHPTATLYYHFESKIGNGDQIPGDAEIIIFMTASNEYGDSVYMYLKIPYKHYGTIKRFIETKSRFDPREFGTIIAAGIGIPTDAVKSEIAEKYGYIPIDFTQPSTLRSLDGDLRKLW